MNLNFKDVTVYSLNPEIYKSRAYYIEELKKLDVFKDVERVAFDYKLKDRLWTIIMAHLFALIKARDAYAFPLLLLEDDARLMKDLPVSMNVPDECNLVYLGGSLYNCGQTPPMYIENYNKDFYRVYYMLCAHAILIMNEKGCKTIVDAYTDAIFKGLFNDVSLSMRSKDNIFLTPKDGMYFYQEGNVEDVTRFLWKDKPNLLK